MDIGSQEVLIQGKIDRLDILEGVAGRDDEISHGDECGDDAGDRADGAYGEHHEDSVRRDPEAEASVRIIDYKTGSETVDPEYFMKGYKLQLMVYMKAAVDAYNGRLEPAGVFYFKIRDVDMDADSTSLPADKTWARKEARGFLPARRDTAERRQPDKLDGQRDRRFVAGDPGKDQQKRRRVCSGGRRLSDDERRIRRTVRAGRYAGEAHLH